MDAITLLHSRNSMPKLCDPAPAGDVLADIIKAGLRAPDHARLRPWRFLTIAGEARSQLGGLLVAATRQRQAAAAQLSMTEQEAIAVAAKALRAPLIVVVIADIQVHPKVPAIEQLISAGCAAHGILLAAHAYGFAGIWRTGSHAYDPVVKQGLGLSATEEIVGFIYLGSIDGSYKSLPDLALEDFCQPWRACLR
jgi:nitroreductase